jgi:hypothetical protein
MSVNFKTVSSDSEELRSHLHPAVALRMERANLVMGKNEIDFKGQQLDNGAHYLVVELSPSENGAELQFNYLDKNKKSIEHIYYTFQETLGLFAAFIDKHNVDYIPEVEFDSDDEPSPEEIAQAIQKRMQHAISNIRNHIDEVTELGQIRDANICDRVQNLCRPLSQFAERIGGLIPNHLLNVLRFAN